MNNQIISLAEVRSRVDMLRNGSFLASIDYLGNIDERVFYVSPYGSNAEGAFVAIPEEGTEILVCRPAGSDSWFYMGTVFKSAEPERTSGGGVIPDAGLLPLQRVDPYLYRARGVPLRYMFKSPSQAGLTMSEEYNPEFINKYTQLKSTVNKTVTLNDSPEIDSIIIDSGNGSKITLTDAPKAQSLPSRALQIETVGPQKYLNYESQTDVVVLNGGRELQILNNANGTEWGDGAVCGNVNIQSKWKDVNVFTQAEGGNIFIECLNGLGNDQHIVIQTNGFGGSIVIKTNGKVIVDAQDDININTAKDLNIKCNKFSVDSATVAMKSSGVVDIDGSIINLANGASTNAVDTTGQDSQYGNTGITTYDKLG